jgi:hypothetical protein
VADLNNDGRLDVIVRPEVNGPIAFYLQGAGAASWQKVEFSSAVTPNGMGLAVADINGDGRRDIVANGFWLQAPALAQIATAGAWARREFTTALDAGNWTTATVEVADINGDGGIDILLSRSPADLSAGTLYPMAWYQLTVGAGGAPADATVLANWTRRDIAPVNNVHAARIIDIDKDGTLDIVFAEMHTATDPRIGIFFGAKNGTPSTGGMTWTMQIFSRDGSHGIDVSDINNDGNFDLLGANSDTTSPDGGALNVWYGLGKQN